MTLKDFLNQLFQREGVEGLGDAMKGDWREKRRSNRVDLSEEEKVEVHLLSPDGQDQGVTVVGIAHNISLRGCRLSFPNKDDVKHISGGQNMVATVTVENFSIPLNVEIIRVVKGEEAAVRFKPPFPKELERLERFLEPRCLGLSIREINPSALQREGKKDFRWFHGINETSLFSWFDPKTGRVTQQQLIFLGMVVEWREGQKVRTGKVREDTPGPDSRMGWVKSELMDFDPIPEAGVLDQAKAVIQNARIDSGVKDALLKNMEAAKK